MGKVKWKWFGMAAHFICGHDCLFHMATQIGKYLISSVGFYVPVSSRMNKKYEAQDIGLDRKYETFVFNTKPGTCSCGCGLPNFDASEIDSLASNTIAEAQINHMKLCKKYDRRSGGAKDGKGGDKQ